MPLVDTLTTAPQDPRRAKLEGGKPFKLVSEFEPAGDQPTAIAELVEGVRAGERNQVLLGATGTGKTFTAAKIIEATQRPAIILAPNKTLAAQLYGEFKGFFPENAVEYFVSYYDYYQPEAYVAAHRHLHRERKPDQRPDRPDAPLGDPGAAGTRRRHHRRLGLLHLRHRLGRDLRRDDPGPDRRPQLSAAPGDRRPRHPAVPAQRQRLRPRQLPRPRRHPRDLARPPRRPRLAALLLRRGARIDRRVRSADRRADRFARADPGLCQLALRDAAPDAEPGDHGHPGTSSRSASTSSSRRASSSRPSGWSSAPTSTSRCWRRPAPATASRTIRAT